MTATAQHPTSWRLRWSTLACAAALTACGGGDDTNTAAATVTPAVVPATITTQPSDTQAAVGAAASFSITVDGTGWTYQWQRSNDGGTVWQPIANATAAVYTLAAVQTTDSGSRFRVLVSRDGASTTSSAVALNVSATAQAPVLTVQPVAQATTAGGNATFTVTATGTGLAYQWQRSSTGTDWADLDGKTQPVLVLTAVTEAQSGQLFRVVLSNATGSVASPAVSLTVAAAPALPAFATPPASTTVTAPAAASFSVQVTGNPAPAVQWQRSTDGGATWVDVAGAQSTTYTTPATRTADSGTRLRAVASSSAGTTTSSAAVLTVADALAAPVLTQQPQDTTVATAQAVTWTASASGNPQPSYQWQFSTDGGSTYANINGATSASYSMVASASDNGRRLRVQVTNSQGTVTSPSALLTVTSAASNLADRAWNSGLRASPSAQQLLPWRTATPVSSIDDQGRTTTLYTSYDLTTLSAEGLWAVRSAPGAAGAASTAGVPVMLQVGQTVTPALQVSANGNQLATWIRTAPCTADPTKSCTDLLAARYLVSTGAWDAPTVVTGLSGGAQAVRRNRINDAGDIAILGLDVNGSASNATLVTRANGDAGFRSRALAVTVGSAATSAAALSTNVAGLALDNAGNFTVAGEQTAADFSQNIVAWRGNLRTNSLGAAQTLDTRGSPATFGGVWASPSGATVVMWSQNNGSQASTFTATLDAASDSWAVSDRAVPPTTASLSTGTVTDDGDFVWYSWSRCSMLRRVRAVWQAEVGLPAGSCSELASPATAVARNGNALLVQPSSGRWSTIDAARQEVVSGFTTSANGAGYVWGLRWTSVSGDALLSSSGVGAFVSINSYDVLPSLAAPSGDSRGSFVGNLWHLFLK